MAAKHVGMIMKHNHRKVLVLRVGLTLDGADAVLVAPFGTAKPKPDGSARAVEAKTWVDDYWVRLDQASVVKAADVVHTWTPPGRLTRRPLDAVLKELAKASR
ncbi:hypothetical protein LZG04_28355 [Saccharothrix sp. S26]|uniref:hypothetical protein n=1 Tax=Saccharothrix sp. S26 TaxID=2907215 RepID=UPI001F325E35|nr:hypothetical protein [Saccharothrix sp. S26]MCE6998679.1 hypothetical protein [Saccharothrix sp. S26]